MKVYKIVFGLIFVLSLSFNAALLIHQFTAQPSHAETPSNQMPLDLTEQQKKQMEPIRLKIHKDNEAIKKEILQCQEKLLTALKTEPVDKQAIHRCIDNISHLQKKIQKNTVEEIIEIRKYMNPDQCNCLMEGLGAAMHQTTKPCNCPYCAQSHKNRE
jgi:Spy/CpxP family protein refolding chaperone